MGLKVDVSREILTPIMMSYYKNVCSCKRHTVVRRAFCFWWFTLLFLGLTTYYRESWYILIVLLQADSDSSDFLYQQWFSEISYQIYYFFRVKWGHLNLIITVISSPPALSFSLPYQEFLIPLVVECSHSVHNISLRAGEQSNPTKLHSESFLLANLVYIANNENTCSCTAVSVR